MDDYTTKHLQAWADDALHEDEREEMVRKMADYVDRNPDVIERSLSWPQIRDIIDRNKEFGIS